MVRLLVTAIWAIVERGPGGLLAIVCVYPNFVASVGS
jgi:hypothetical protein